MATYNISTLAELQAISPTHLADDCVLLNDIDASDTATWNQGTGANADEYYGFLPVGMGTGSFTGTFDGQGFKITNLYINRTATNGASAHDRVAFIFDYSRVAAGAGGFLKDLTLENVNIKGADYVAGVAGSIQASDASHLEVSNVYVTGTIEGTEGANGIGGFVGTGIECTYTDCSASVTINHSTTRSAITKIGGFIGVSQQNTMTDCLSNVTIDCDFSAGSSSALVGGFVGQVGASGNADTLTGCTSTGTMTLDIETTSILYIGGFTGTSNTSSSTLSKCFAHTDIAVTATTPKVEIGGFSGAHSMTIEKSGATGNIENYSENATTNLTGGFVGTFSTGTISNCFAKGDVCVNSGVNHADAAIGGFAGSHVTSGTIENCYSTGQVYATGPPTNGGGFLGSITGTPTETALFWDTQTSGWATSAGDAVGKTTTLMKTESTFTDESWDFDSIWYLPTYTRSPGLATQIWLSKVGDYNNYDEGTKDSDAFSLGIPTTNVILWLESLESLLLGTSGDEWQIGSNKLQTPISPTNFAVKQQTTYGSADLQALKVNDIVLFVDYVKRKVRELTYEDPKYTAPDMTALAEHITETGIVNMAYQKNPNSTLWCVLTDGTLISLVYDREQNVIAWSTHVIDGTVQSVCVIPGTDEDEVWLSVTRTNGVFIEKMATRIQGDIEDSYYVDSGITDTGTSATITGLDHLDGETVAALVDGVYDGTFTVSSGSITLNTTPTAQTIVGLPFTALLQPMRIIQNGPSGTSMGAMTRIHGLKVTFLNTLGSQYGSSTDDLYSFNFSDERLEDATYITGLFSGDVPIEMPGGYSMENPIIISSSQPLPMTVKAIVVNFEQTGR